MIVTNVDKISGCFWCNTEENELYCIRQLIKLFSESGLSINILPNLFSVYVTKTGNRWFQENNICVHTFIMHTFALDLKA